MQSVREEIAALYEKKVRNTIELNPEFCLYKFRLKIYKIQIVVILNKLLIIVQILFPIMNVLKKRRKFVIYAMKKCYN